LRALSTPIESKNQQFAHAGRAGNAFVCTNCGVPLNPKRGSRRQLYCSYRCRDEARRARNFAASASTRRGSPAIPRPVENNDGRSRTYRTDFRDRASHICGPRVVIEVEVAGRSNWAETISVDSVRTEVAQLSRAPRLSNRRAAGSRPGCDGAEQ
jgi:hypothetical protein